MARWATVTASARLQHAIGHAPALAALTRPSALAGASPVMPAPSSAPISSPRTAVPWSPFSSGKGSRGVPLGISAPGAAALPSSSCARFQAYSTSTILTSSPRPPGSPAKADTSMPAGAAAA